MAFYILMVEDDPEICEAVGDFFTDKSGGQFQMEYAKDGDCAMELLYEKEYDLVLLDVMLPKISGFEICQYIRNSSTCPIIFVTARGRQDDILAGYELGADDYVVKPFSIAELYAKVHALLKRSKGMVLAQELVCGQIRLNPVTLQVYAGKEKREIPLAAKEFHLLRVLMDHRGSVVSRDMLLTRIWGYDFDGSERVVDNHIRKLRKALGDCGKQIQTVFGHGYRLRDENERRESS